MKLTLVGYKLVKMSFQAIGPGTKCGMRLGFGQFYPESEKRILGLGFDVSLQSEEFSLDTEMRFFFEGDQNMDDEFKTSSFPIINAPAIAFPYLRSFISILTVQAGYAPVIIPSINFVEFAKNASRHNGSEKL